MGTSCLLIAAALSSGVVSWEDAGHLPTRAIARPAPIEPDADGKGPFRAEPPKPGAAPPSSVVARSPGCTFDPYSCDPCECKPKPQAKAVPAVVVWRPDAYGFYWVRKPDGSFAGDRSRTIVSPHGVPVNPDGLPRYSAPPAPSAEFSAPRYRVSPRAYCTTGNCR